MTLVEELEQKILNGENISPLELAQASQTSDAAKRIMMLRIEREFELQKTQLAEIEALKASARNAATPLERIRLGFEIKQKEEKFNDKFNDK